MTEDRWQDVLKNIWPQERDVVSRPDRLKYLRRAANPQECVFCEARDQGIKPESLCIYKDDHAMVILNKYPYNTGHLLVLPARHVGRLEDLSAEDYQQMMLVLKKSVGILEQVYQCTGVNVGMNYGQVAGAGIPGHMHWHVIPRWAGDTNFFPLIAETKVVPETLEQTFAKLRPLFAKGTLSE